MSRVLHLVFLKNRLHELGLKQWWLAEQIGVDRKTVGRWLQGKVKVVQEENARAVARVLGCTLDELTAPDEAATLATPEDQRHAAELLARSSLLEKLGPLGEWDVIESLLRATTVPGLPRHVLGEQLQLLCVASWRQSKFEQAERFNRQAETIARETGDRPLLAEVLVSKANLHSWAGRVREAVATYEECLALGAGLPARTEAAACSNLGAVLFEAGEPVRAESWQRRALELFLVHGQPMNLSIAWCHLAMLLLERAALAVGAEAIEKSLAFAAAGDYRRGLAMGELLRAELFARRREPDGALASLASGLGQFRLQGVDEALNHEVAARVHRHLGDRAAAAREARQGLALREQPPMYRAALHRELAQALDEPGEAAREAAEAIRIFTECGALPRAEQARKLLPPGT